MSPGHDMVTTMMILLVVTPSDQHPERLLVLLRRHPHHLRRKLHPLLPLQVHRRQPIADVLLVEALG